MSKTFTYTKITGRYYLDYTDEWEEDGIDFEYEVDDDRLLDAVIDFVSEGYFESGVNIDELREFINDFDLLDKLVESYKDELKDYFEQEALECYD